MRVAILSDTNSGITQNEAGNIGVYVMPMPIIIDDEIYYEGQNISEDEFYNALTSDSKVTTSQPSPGDVMDMWDALLRDGYEEIVYIPMSSGLSNSCHAAMGYAADYDGKVEVVDNHRISVTMRQSVMRARFLADRGMNASEIKNILENEAYQSSIYISVNTLEYLKKGGRITPAAAMIGTVLNIKPILTIQGEKLDSFARIRGKMQKCEHKMVEAIRADIENRFSDVPMENVYIGAAGAGLTGDEQQEWLDMVRREFEGANIYYDPLSASIGCHTGPGAVGIGVSVKRGE
ncbi:MAG: DegV family protein [Wujia sp.]